MNARIFLTLALALPLSAQAQSQPPIPEVEPVRAVAPKSVFKSCDHNASLFLERRDVAKGMGYWTPAMNRLRDEANRQATQVCREGWPGVKFTFLRGKGTGDNAVAIATTP